MRLSEYSKNLLETTSPKDYLKAKIILDINTPISIINWIENNSEILFRNKINYTIKIRKDCLINLQSRYLVSLELFPS